MANISSQIKRNRQNEKRRLRNRDFRGAARTAVKDALTSIATGQDSSATVMAAISALDKAAQKGAIHRRNAARRKGRLLKRLAALQPGGQPLLQARPRVERTSPAAEKAPAGKPSSGPEKREPVAPKSKGEARKAAASVDKKATQKKPAVKKTAKK